MVGVCCCVRNCPSRSHDNAGMKLGNGIRFFGFPRWKQHEGPKVGEVTRRRRGAWVSAVRRKGVTFNEIAPSMKVCSLHFHSRQPAYEMLESDPDWVPSLNLGYNDSTRQSKPKQLSQNSNLPAEERGLLDGSSNQPEEGAHEDEQVAPSPSQEEARTGCYLCTVMGKEVSRLMEENRELRHQLSQYRMSDGYFGKDDDKVRYYTGLPNLETFMAFFHFLLPHMPEQKTILTPFQMLTLTLMRLRLALPAQHIAYLFYISPSEVCKTYNDMVLFLYTNLRQSLVWPDRHTLHKMMPEQIFMTFGRTVAVIVDSLEVATDQNQTRKYLMGMTPSGLICFLSKGWPGSTSDKHIIYNSGLLENLLPGDIVLAGRGFDLQERDGMLCAEVKSPDLKHGVCQLDAKDVEETRKLAHLQVHIERVVGSVSRNYKMLTGTIPNQMMSQEATFLDRVVIVCCALMNRCTAVD